jgi:hypothetical protein
MTQYHREVQKSISSLPYRGYWQPTFASHHSEPTISPKGAERNISVLACDCHELNRLNLNYVRDVCDISPNSLAKSPGQVSPDGMGSP